MAVEALAVSIQSAPARLEFLPLGEDSMCTPAVACSSGCSGSGLSWVSKRRCARFGNCRSSVRAEAALGFCLRRVHVAAVFPFIPGRILAQASCATPDRGWRNVHRVRMDGLPRERFETSFATDLERVAASGLLTRGETSQVRLVSDEIEALGNILRTCRSTSS